MAPGFIARGSALPVKELCIAGNWSNSPFLGSLSRGVSNNGDGVLVEIKRCFVLPLYSPDFAESHIEWYNTTSSKRVYKTAVGRGFPRHKYVALPPSGLYNGSFFECYKDFSFPAIHTFWPNPLLLRTYFRNESRFDSQMRKRVWEVPKTLTTFLIINNLRWVFQRNLNPYFVSDRDWGAFVCIIRRQLGFYEVV